MDVKITFLNDELDEAIYIYIITTRRVCRSRAKKRMYIDLLSRCMDLNNHPNSGMQILIELCYQMVARLMSVKHVSTKRHSE